jgi:hypothetical protein
MFSRMLPLTKKQAILVLILGWLILCKPWFVNHRVVPWDSKDVFYPFARFISQSIRAGQSPFWNPYVYGGYPMASDPQSMMFSPLGLILMLAVNKPTMHWFDTIELLHVLLGGIGMLLLSMRFGRSPPASLFSAAVFMFGGSAAARLQHVPIIYAYSYFPYALLALEEMLESGLMRWAVGFGVVAAIMAAHMNQVAYLLSLVLIGYYLYRAVTSGSIASFVASRWRVTLVSAIAGAVVLAIPLYLVLQFLPFSSRNGIPYDDATANPMGPIPLLTLVIRNFIGSGRPDMEWGPWEATQSLLYVGTLPIVLILRYGLAGDALLDRRIRYFSAVGVLSVLYAMGSWTPFYWFVFHFLPGVSLYRRPPDATFVLNIMLALATGFLVDRLQAGDPGRIRGIFLWTGATAFSALLAWGLYMMWTFHRVAHMVQDFVLAVLFILAALWLWHAIATATTDRRRMNLIHAGIILLAFDLGIHTVGTYLNAVPDNHFLLLAKDAEQHDPIASFLKTGLETGNSGPYRADITLAGELSGNAPMIFGIQSAEGYNPLRYSLYDRVAGAQPSVADMRAFSNLIPGYSSPLLNLLGVKYIVSLKSLREIDPGVDEKHFPLVLDRTIHVWENPNVLPRVIAATAVYMEPNLELAINSGAAASVDYRSTVVLSHVPETLVGVDAKTHVVCPLPGRGEPMVHVLGYRNNEVTIDVETERDVILELNDPYYFPWRVYVDGHERELLQANYLFRGVHVKRGEHHVVFRFEPFSWSAIRRTLRIRGTGV